MKMQKRSLQRLLQYSPQAPSFGTEDEENQLRRFLYSALSGDLVTLKNMADVIGNPVDGLAKHYAGIMDMNGLNALHYAAFGGKIEACDYLIKKVKIDVDTKDFQGETPLHHAIKGEHDDAAVYLLESGANPNAASVSGQTALHFAAEKGSREIMNLLISKGAAVDPVAEIHGTPLHRAAYNGKEEAVEILLNHHVNPDGPDIDIKNLHTPLGASICGDSLDCVDLLVKAGAKLNTPSCGLSPLQLAAVKEKTEILKYLVEKGADPAIYYSNATALELSGLRLNYEAMEILFPKTPPLSCVPKWSFEEVVRHFEEYKIECEYEEFKRRGTEAYERGDNIEAIDLFTVALDRNPKDIDILLQRSRCWGDEGLPDFALFDAEECVKARPDLSLAHFRKGQAYMLLKDPVKSADSYLDALLIDPDEKDYWSAFGVALDAEAEYMRTLRDLKSLNFSSRPTSPTAKHDLDP